MRHQTLRPVRVIIFTSALLLAVGRYAPVAHAEPPTWNGSPVLGVARLAPLDRLQRDFEFLADGVDRGTATTAILDVLADLSEGIDPRRPAGAMVLFDQTYVPMIFVPLKDEQRLFAVFKTRFGWEFRREANDQYRYTADNSDIDLVARVSGSWVYVTGFSHREHLQSVPDDPTVLFDGSDPTLTAHATFRFDQFPEELRAQITGAISEAAADSEGPALARDGSALAAQMVQRLFAETKSLQFELQCFRPLQQFHVTTRLQAVDGSRLERWIEDASHRTTRFSYLPSGDSIFAMITSMKLDPQITRRLLEAWQPLAAQAKAAAPSPRSRDRAEGLLGRFVERAVDAVTATIQPGQLDGGFVVERQGRDQIVVLAGTTLKGAREVEEAAVDVAQLLQQAAEFRALGWSVGQNGDVGIHQLNVPADDENARAMLGDPIVMAIGVGDDCLYAAVGGDATVERLAEVVERSRDDTPQRGDMIRIHARMAPLLAVLNAVPGSGSETDATLRKLATQIAPFKKNDTLELSLTARDQALEGRLQIDMGIVRMLAPQVPVTPSPAPRPASGEIAGLLQLPAGERFQLEFRSQSHITTTIDGNDRLDLGVQSLTYDFHVSRVDAEGTMHIDTSLSRAVIDKTSPEGRESFDSANPPEPDKMTAEMTLYGVVVGQKFVIAVRPDGTIAEIAGIQQAIENVVDTKLQPPAAERERACAFVSQLLNEQALRDSLTRGFEFYPGEKVAAGARWTRTTENLTLMNFLLDNRYQVKALSADEMVISVRSQVREPDADAVPDQPVRWEIVGSQTGTIQLDPQGGRLQLAEYTLRLDAEATFAVEGKTVSRPIIGEFKMTIGTPQQLAGNVSAAAPARTADSMAWIDLTSDAALSKWRPTQPAGWRMQGSEIVSLGGNYDKWSYCEYAGETFADFELTAEVQCGAGSNGGICIRATQGGLDGDNPSGYEVQLLGIPTNRNPTGSIYKMPNKGPVSSLYSAAAGLAQPDQWFSVRVVAQDTKLSVFINNKQVAAGDDLQGPVRSGHIILQGSPQGVIRYKDVRIRQL